MIKLRFASLALCLLAVCGIAFSETNCVDNQECLIDLPGTQCGDGTQSYLTLTKRPGAKNTLIYLSGGGACWDRDTCEGGYVQSLTREPEPQDFSHGSGIQDASDANNPFGKDYNVIYVPYCTGDAYTGNRLAEYGSPGKPFPVNHHGYQNVQKVIEKVKELYPSPEKVVMLGCSAGGIGAYFHLRDLAAAYPATPKYVISDAGTPFSPPFIDPKKYDTIMKAWGSDTELFVNPHTGKRIASFADLIQYNTQEFTGTRFGLIDGYRDKVMTFFGWAIGAVAPLQAVRDTLISVADNAIGRNAPNAKVFYTEDDMHCHTPNALGSVISGKANLGTWLSNMIQDRAEWQNERPDLEHAIAPADGNGGTLGIDLTR